MAAAVAAVAVVAVVMASLVKKIISTAKAPAALGPYRYVLAGGGSLGRSRSERERGPLEEAGVSGRGFCQRASSRSLEGRGVCQTALGVKVTHTHTHPPAPSRDPVTPPGHRRPYSRSGSAVLAANWPDLRGGGVSWWF